MSRIKRIILTIAASLGLIAPFATPVMTHAQTANLIDQGLCAGSNLKVGDTTCATGVDDSADRRINNIIETVINIFSLVVGIAAVIMIIVGGLKYITSGGESGNVSGAKNTILYAVIGLVVVALAQIIVRFVLSRAQDSGTA